MTKTSPLADILVSIRTGSLACSRLFQVQRKYQRTRESSRIRRAVIVVLAMLGSVFLSNCGGFPNGGKTEWKKYDIEDGNFAISLPTAPTTETKTQNVAGQRIEVKMVHSEDGRVTYAVMYCDYPGGNVFSDSPQELFDAAQADLAKRNPGAIVVSTKKVSLDRFTGREIQISASGGIHYLRLFYVRFRLFQVHASVPTGTASTVDVTRFLNSFRLLGN